MVLKSKKSKNNKRKRKQSDDHDDATASTKVIGWQKVAVELDDTNHLSKKKKGTTGDDQNNDETDNNHYDNPQLQKRATKDLPVKPGEDIAMFLGLEVLDGSQYKLVNSNQGGTGNKRIVILQEEGEGKHLDQDNEHDQDQGTAKQSKKTKKKKKKKKSKTSITEDSTDTDAKHGDEEGDSSAQGGENKMSKESKSQSSEIQKVEVTSEPAESSVRKRKENNQNKNNDENGDGVSASTSSSSSERKGKKTKQDSRQENSTTTSTVGAGAGSTATTSELINAEKLQQISHAWSEGGSNGVFLHDALLQSLARRNFDTPTPIQATTLSASILGRRNLVAAAPTGSGKTLAFLLPILQHILADSTDVESSSSPCLRALILTPTRELATQIHQESERLVPNQCVCLVGGIAWVKQLRLLQTKRPSIIVGTPGRIWAMMNSHHDSNSSKNKDMINPLHDLSRIRFLVLDEADRMIQQQDQQASFPQLMQIMDAIHEEQAVTSTADDKDSDDDNDDEEEEDSEDECDDQDEEDENVDMEVTSQNTGEQQEDDKEEKEDNDDDDDDDEEDDDGDDDDDDVNRLLGLPGIRGESSVMMLNDDILKQIEIQRNTLPPPTPAQSKRIDVQNDDSSDDDSHDDEVQEGTKRRTKKIQRQTFIFSATLTLPYTLTDLNSVKNKNRARFLADSQKQQRGRGRGKKGIKATAWDGLDGAIAEIMQRAHATGKTKVVDLSSSNQLQQQRNNHPTSAAPGIQLPPGLSIELIKCTQKHKDSHLYAYLLHTTTMMTTTRRTKKRINTNSEESESTTPSGHGGSRGAGAGGGGPCLIFCNSIAAVRRVGTTLQTLGMPVRILHAQMQQRARFKAVESLQDPTRLSIVVCTDVAARGLDIPSVATVVHYDAARSVDTFVHRAGRTARGVGDEAVGCSLSLISSAEDRAHAKIAQALSVPFTIVSWLDGRLLTSAQERVNLASKIVTANEIEQKSNSHNRWFLEKAKEADLEVDDEMLENEDNRSEREKQQLREAKKAKTKLSLLLSEPIRMQRFGKFLSTNSSLLQRDIQPLAMTIETQSVNKKGQGGKSKRKRGLSKNTK